MGSCYRRERTVKGRRYREDKYTVSWFDSVGQRWRTKKAFRDKKASEELLRQLELRSDRSAVGLPVAPDAAEQAQRTWAVAVAAYRADLTRLGRAPRYIWQTANQLTLIGQSCGWKTVSAMRADAFRSFLTTLNRAPSTCNQYRAVASCFAAWCVGQGWLEGNPLSGVPRASLGAIGDVSRRPRARRALTLEEFRRLTSCPGIKPWRRDFYLVAGLSGLRVGEMAALTASDFVLGERPRWQLWAASTKAKRRDVVPMLPECAAIMARLATAKAPLAKIFRCKPSALTFNRDLATAGIPKKDSRGRQANRHSLRCTFCTLCAARLSIKRVQQLMRHSSITLTMDTYADLGIEDLADMVEALPNVLGNLSTCAAEVG